MVMLNITLNNDIHPIFLSKTEHYVSIYILRHIPAYKYLELPDRNAKMQFIPANTHTPDVCICFGNLSSFISTITEYWVS